MLDPLSELVTVLNRVGTVPEAWRARHAPAGDLASAWIACEVPRVMCKVLFMAARDDDAARANAAAQAVFDAMRGSDVGAIRRHACEAIRAAVPLAPRLDELASAFAR